MASVIDQETQIAEMEAVVQDINLSDAQKNIIDITSEKIKKTLKKLNDPGLCKICRTSNSFYANLPCYHVTSCQSCAPNTHTCPVCHKPIRHFDSYGELLQKASDRLMRE